MTTLGCRLAMMVVLASGCVRWSHQDTAMEVGFAALTAGDWAQTRGIVNVCSEENPVIGRCGDGMPVAMYFPLTIAAHAAIAAVLPPRWRTAWQAVGAGAELNQVWRNDARGYGIDGSVPPPPPGYQYVHPDGSVGTTASP